MLWHRNHLQLVARFSCQRAFPPLHLHEGNALDDNLTVARTDPFGRGVSAFADGAGQDACPYPQEFFEGRQWLLGWSFGRSRSAARVFADRLA